MKRLAALAAVALTACGSSEMPQAIPPAYSQWIGEHLLSLVDVAA